MDTKKTKALYYVFTMAKAKGTDKYILSLNHINTVRKYYSDLLARRTTKKTPAATPVA